MHVRWPAFGFKKNHTIIARTQYVVILLLFTIDPYRISINDIALYCELTFLACFLCLLLIPSGTQLLTAHWVIVTLICSIIDNFFLIKWSPGRRHSGRLFTNLFGFLHYQLDMAQVSKGRLMHECLLPVDGYRSPSFIAMLFYVNNSAKPAAWTTRSNWSALRVVPKYDMFISRNKYYFIACFSLQNPCYQSA